MKRSLFCKGPSSSCFEKWTRNLLLGSDNLCTDRQCVCYCGFFFFFAVVVCSVFDTSTQLGGGEAQWTCFVLLPHAAYTLPTMTGSNFGTIQSRSAPTQHLKILDFLLRNCCWLGRFPTNRTYKAPKVFLNGSSHVLPVEQRVLSRLVGGLCCTLYAVRGRRTITALEWAPSQTGKRKRVIDLGFLC